MSLTAEQRDLLQRERANRRGATAITPEDYVRFKKARRTALPNELARARDGAAFILDAPTKVPALWGDGDEVLWPKDEPLMIAGPQGVGKTTVAQRLALHRAGVLGGDLLGMPVAVSAGRVLYIAADRPPQAARSARRMVTEADRAALKTAVITWRGPLPFDLGRCQRGDLAGFVANWSEVTDVYIDALKDCAVKLTDDEVGSRVNAEFQHLVAGGVQLVVDHHQRKAGSDNKKPAKLDDVFGSVWLTSGCGSVVLLWGEAGSPIVELRHLKPPAAEVGPMKLLHDHGRGAIAVHEAEDLVAIAADTPGDGLTARAAAIRLYGTADPTANQIEKARLKLKRHRHLIAVPDSHPIAWRPKASR